MPGFQAYSSAAGRPLDDPPMLEVLEYAFNRGLVCLLHPETPGSDRRPSSKASRSGWAKALLVGQPEGPTPAWPKWASTSPFALRSWKAVVASLIEGGSAPRPAALLSNG